MNDNHSALPEPVDGVDITWEDARAANLANWEDRVPLHLEAYRLDRLREDPQHVTDVVRDDLPVLRRHVPGGILEGLALCHLQCHIGTDTVSLARAGAHVTGIDFSPSALMAARLLAQDLGIEATFIETDVLDARAAVDAQLGPQTTFDVVYTSIGTITWLRDLDRWAEQVAALVAPGGLFYIRDGHPLLYALDEYAPGITLTYRYFGDGTALSWDEPGTYVGEGTVTHTRTYEWPHPVSEIVTVLLKHGLTIVALEEGTTLPWKFSERMVELDDGNFAYPDAERALVPCTLTVVARKSL